MHETWDRDLMPETHSHLDISENEHFLGQRISDQVSCLLKGLQVCRRNGLFTDIVLCAHEEEFPCHKVILAASSRYFNAMFMSPFTEQQTSRVYLKQISPWALKQLIDFAYIGCLDLTITTVQDVFVAANLLDYPLAVRACVEFMEQHLDIANCLGVQLLAETYNFPLLAETARKMAVENFTRLIDESSEWTSLPVSSVATYLRSEDLDVRFEKTVLKACLIWVGNDPDNRLHYLVPLLHHVRLHQIPTRLLEEVLDSSPILRDCAAALVYVGNVVKNELKSSNQSAQGNGDAAQLLPPRPSTVEKETLVVIGGINTLILDSLEALSFAKSPSSWVAYPSLPVDSLTWFSTVVAKNTLIVTGGIRAGSIVSSVYLYSVEKNAWSVGCEMPVPRARHTSVAVADSLVFLFGGLSISGQQQYSTNSEDTSDEAVPSLALVEAIHCYDMDTDQWTTVGSCRTPRQGSSVAVISSALATITGSSSLDGEGEERSQASRDSLGDSLPEYTIVELGGTLDVEANQISKRMAIYRVDADRRRVESSDDYIALQEPVQFSKCVINPYNQLVYIFWEATGGLSVLDFHRQSLRALKPLHLSRTSGDGDEVEQEARVYSGCAWVDGRLFVLGGYSRFDGADRHPTCPRSDLHCYRPDIDEWSLVSVGDQSVPRAICGCVCLKM